MHQRPTRPIRIVAAATATAALVLGACGSDSSGGSTEAFCDDLYAIGEADDQISDEEGLELLQAAAANAPSEISAEMNEFVDLFEQLLVFDEATATDEQMAEFTVSAAEFDESSATIEAFAKENCLDLPADFFG